MGLALIKGQSKESGSPYYPNRTIVEVVYVQLNELIYRILLGRLYRLCLLRVQSNIASQQFRIVTNCNLYLVGSKQAILTLINTNLNYPNFRSNKMTHLTVTLSSVLRLILLIPSSSHKSWQSTNPNLVTHNATTLSIKYSQLR
ncbi:Hypothetical_protein [Hexamita inflata]|uniref:Hypothetical_protein n=1 Tax=Hexamita inflata TaxID=28002 RepID=A0AA86N5F1_9EUKA|nr:Hypothetical protein HINF_LOCUS972 [Hexamita inflata]